MSDTSPASLAVQEPSNAANTTPTATRTSNVFKPLVAETAKYSRDKSKAVNLFSSVQMRLGKKVATTAVIHRLAPRVSADTIAALTLAGASRWGAGSYNTAVNANIVAHTGVRDIIDTTKLASASYLTRVNSTSGHLAKVTYSGMFNLLPLARVCGIVLAAEAMYGFTFSNANVTGICGGAARVVGISHHTAVSEGNRGVVLSRELCAVVGEDVKWYLIALINATGATAYIDSIAYQGAVPVDWRPYTSRDALYRAINVVFGILEANAQLTAAQGLFDLGLNDVISVVGECEEGAIPRPAFRCAPCLPASGVMTTVGDGVVAPFFNVGMSAANSNRATIYSRLIAFAARWTASDPTVEYEDACHLPSIAVNNSQPVYASKPGAVGVAATFADDAVRTRVRQMLAVTKSAFTLRANEDDLSEDIIAKAQASAVIDLLRAAGARAAVAADPGNNVAAQAAVQLDKDALVELLAVASTLPGGDGLFSYMTTFKGTGDMGERISRYIAGGQAMLTTWFEDGVVDGVVELARARANALHNRRDPSAMITALGESLFDRGGLSNFRTLHEEAYGADGSGQLLEDVWRLCFSAYFRRVMRTFENGEDVYDARHVCRQLTMMYSWIEATGCVSPLANVPAVRHLNASFVEVDGVASYPAFNGEYAKHFESGVVRFEVVGAHSLRSLHIVNFYRNHVLGGLEKMACTRVMEGESMSLVPDADHQLESLSGVSLDATTWSYGTHAFPFAGEYFSMARATEYAYATEQLSRGNKGVLGALLGFELQKNHMYHPEESMARTNGQCGTMSYAPPIVSYMMGAFNATDASTYTIVARRATVPRSKAERMMRINERAMRYRYSGFNTFDSHRHYVFATAAVDPVHQIILNTAVTAGGVLAVEGGSTATREKVATAKALRDAATAARAAEAKAAEEKRLADEAERAAELSNMLKLVKKQQLMEQQQQQATPLSDFTNLGSSPRTPQQQNNERTARAAHDAALKAAALLKVMEDDAEYVSASTTDPQVFETNAGPGGPNLELHNGIGMIDLTKSAPSTSEHQ